MGKKGQDRVKGSFQPSSSSRAAELLGSAPGQALSFSSFGMPQTYAQSNSGYSSPNLSANELQADYSGLTNELVVVIKNLNKRNSRTKLKALEELLSLAKSFTELNSLIFFDHWCTLYPKLTIDINRRIRFLANQIHIELVGKLGKKLTQYLKKISGSWICSQFDQSKEISQLVKIGLNNTFPNDKIKKMLQFCQSEIFDYIQYNLLYQTLDNLADPRFYNPEEQAQKYSQVITCSLDGWAYLLENLPFENLPQYEPQYRSILDAPEFWSFTQNQQSPAIRASIYRFLMKFVIIWKEGASEYISQLASSFLSKCFTEKDTSTHIDLWNTLLIVTKELPDTWLQTKKPQLPKLFQCLKNKCYGSHNIVLPALIVLVDNLPNQIKSPVEEFYQNLFDSIYSGYNSQPGNNEQKQLVITTITELLLHALSTNLKQSDGKLDSSVQDKLLTDLSLSLIKVSFSNRYYPNCAKLSAKYLVDLNNLLAKYNLDSNLIQGLLNGIESFITGLLNGEQIKFEELEFGENLAEKVSEFINQLTSFETSEPISNFTQSLINTLLNNYKLKFSTNSFSSSQEFSNFAILSQTLIKSNSKYSKTILELVSPYLSKYMAKYSEEIIELILVGFDTNALDKVYCEELIDKILEEIYKLDINLVFINLSKLVEKFNADYLPLDKLQAKILDLFNENIDLLTSDNNENTQLLINLTVLTLSNSEILINTNYHHHQLQVIYNLINSNLSELDFNNESNTLKLTNLLDILATTKLSSDHSADWLNLLTSEEASILDSIVKLNLLELHNLGQLSEKSNLILETLTEHFLQTGDSLIEYGDRLVSSYQQSLLSLPIRELVNLEAAQKFYSLINLISHSEYIPTDNNLYMKLIPIQSELESIVNTDETDNNSKLDTFKGFNNLLGLYLLTKSDQTTTTAQSDKFLNLDQFISFLVNYLNLLNSKDFRIELDQLILLINCLMLAKTSPSLIQSSQQIDQIIVKLVSGNFTEINTKLATVLFESYLRLKQVGLVVISSVLTIWECYLNLFKAELFTSNEDLNLIGRELDNILEKDKFIGISLLNVFNNLFKDSDYSNEFELNLIESYLTEEVNNNNEFDLTKLAYSLTSTDQIRFNNSQLLADKLISKFPSIASDNLGLIANLLILLTKLADKVSFNLQGHGNLLNKLVELIDDNIVSEFNIDDLKLTYIQSLTLQLICKLERLKSSRTNLELIWDNLDQSLSTNLLNLVIKENYYLDDKLNCIRKNYLSNLCNLIPAINPMILKVNPPVNQLCNLLKSPEKNLSRSSYLLVRRAIAFQLLLVKQKLDAYSGNEEELDTSELLEIPKFLLNNLHFDHNEENDNSSHFTYLLSWSSIMDYLEVMNLNLKNSFIEKLKEAELLDDLIPYIIDLLKIKSNKPFDCLIWNFTKIQIRGLENDFELGLPLLGCNLYFRLLRCLPSYVRQWWNNCSNRKLISDFENYTQRYFSKYLIQTELHTITTSETYKSLQDSDFSLKILKNEIFGQYLIDENIIDIHIKIPSNFPLLPVKVDGKRHSGVPENRWRAWLLNTSAVFVTQNGTVADAIQLFKKNIKLHFDGVEDCTICYSVIGVIDRSLPNRQCKTCKNKFHSACLFKWFRTSNQSTCPLCRNIF